jgi:transposase
MAWAKEGVALDWQKLLPPEDFQVLPRRWVVERMFSRIDQNRRMSKDYERLPETGEVVIYVVMPERPFGEGGGVIPHERVYTALAS